MSKIIGISTKKAVEYLNYQGPVFGYSPRRIDPNHENFLPLKRMVAAYYNQGGI